MLSREWWKKRSLRVRDDKVTKAAELSLRESLVPICLVTILFFLWGFSYGLLDTLNKHFQETLHITKSRSAGLQVAYFGYVLLFILFVTTITSANHSFFPAPIPSPPSVTPLGSFAASATVLSLSGVSSFMASGPSSRSHASRPTPSPASAFASSSSATAWALSRRPPTHTSLSAGPPDIRKSASMSPKPLTALAPS